MSLPGRSDLPPGVTMRDIDERFGDTELPLCQECRLPFSPLYEDDRICSECRKKSPDDNT